MSTYAALATFVSFVEIHVFDAEDPCSADASVGSEKLASIRQ